MAQPIRIALAGAGAFGQKHLDALKLIDGVQVTSVIGRELEKLDGLKRKFDAAGKFADIGQLGIAPQCGFASTEEGNRISVDDQKRKLDLVVRTAEAIWGGVDK